MCLVNGVCCLANSVGRERLNHERLIFMYSQFVGSVVDVLVSFCKLLVKM